MSIWSDIGNAISDAADTVAGIVEDVVNAVEEVITDVFETVGNVVSNVFNAVGDYLGAAIGEGAVLGSAVRGVFHWMGDTVSGVTDLAGAVIKGVFGIVGGLIAGVIRLVGGGIGGLLAWDGTAFVKGVENILYGIGGAVVLVGGKLIGLVQSVIPMPGQRTKRPLTQPEEDILKMVFRRSVALYNIRIIPGYAGFIFGINNRPFTLGNTIYMKGDANVPKVLVHECTHVWQYQNVGARYTANAITAQWTEGYSWEAELARGATRWQDFNFEAEGQFLEDLFAQGRVIGSPATGNGEFYIADPVGANVEFKRGAANHTVLANESVAYVRDAFAWRLSALL